MNHHNRLKQRLRAGAVATVVAGHSGSADTIDFVGPLGFDGFWLEGEHGPLTWDRLGDLSRACDLWEMAAVVRVRALEESLIVLARPDHPEVAAAIDDAVARIAAVGARFISAVHDAMAPKP